MTMRASSTDRFLPSAPICWALVLSTVATCWLGRLAGGLVADSAFTWPSGGVLLGFLLAYPPRQWAAISVIGIATRTAAGLALAGLTMPPLDLAALNASVAIGSAFVLRRLLGQSPDLSGTRSFLTVVAVAVGAVPAAGAALALALSIVTGPPDILRFGRWYVAHAQGVLTTAPLVLCWLRGDLAEAVPRGKRLRCAALLGAFGLLLLAVFGQDRYPLMFLVPLAFLVLAAQFGFVGVTLGIGLLAPISLAFASLGEGPFALRASMPMAERQILTQLFVVATFLFAHWVASLIADRRRHEAALLAERDELAASEQRLRESEAGFRLLANSTSDVIVRLGLDLRIVSVSAACLRVFGYKEEAVLGYFLPDGIHPEDVAEARARFDRLVAGEADRDLLAYRIHSRRHPQMWVEASIGLLRDDAGHPASIIMSVRDITERQAQADRLLQANKDLDRLAQQLTLARDRAEQANRAKSRFLAGMSHELRTPLNGILGYAQLLRIEGGLRGEQAARVDGMLTAGQHLLDMINIVLDISQIEAERVELHPADVETAQLARSCLDLVRPTALAKGLALESAFDPDTPMTIRADPTRLRQVMLNMLGNAVKFTARGSVVLRLRPAESCRGLRIEVADTGPGIRDEQRAQLFQDFERLGADAQGAVEGAGLGLALSARLATLLGGGLGHEHNPGGGSIFWLELPLGPVASAGEAPPASAAPSAREPAAAAAPPAACAKLRVLVVDDVAMNREIASAFLEAAGHEAECAESGAEALRVAAAGDYDVVLMDVCMPEMDGCAATRLIRALDSPRCAVPIVALTAQVFSEHLEECHAAGMDVHLAKPFTQEALLAALADALDKAGKRTRSLEPAGATPA